LDTCHAGDIATFLPGQVLGSDIQILPASTAAGSAWVDPNTCRGFSTEAAITDLNSNIFDFSRIANDMLSAYTDRIGQIYSVEDSGTATFTGLQPQLWEGAGFSGDLLGPTFSIQPPPVPSGAISNGIFQLSLSNVPNSGSIAIEVSTDLISWLQVAFNPATGTNLNYSFTVTNAPYQFFRAKIVP